jgi:protein TonB
LAETLIRTLQPSKHCFPNDVTEEGMVMLVNSSQFSKYWFPSGDFKMQQYLKKKTKSVSSRRNGNGQGKVVVSFMVSDKGKLSDFKVTISTNASLNKDAMNIIKSMPNLTPAKREGKNLKSKMSVVVNFE